MENCPPGLWHAESGVHLWRTAALMEALIVKIIIDECCRKLR
jgi:hypothetical protein